mmetsp:Transcript_22194/g.34908  ORF Transcript_22194/g.34908 Transcript_22194/m.34908 type:complete len:261 (+) Transcript_22194:214-996(+)
MLGRFLHCLPFFFLNIRPAYFSLFLRRVFFFLTIFLPFLYEILSSFPHHLLNFFSSSFSVAGQPFTNLDCLRWSFDQKHRNSSRVMDVVGLPFLLCRNSLITFSISVTDTSLEAPLLASFTTARNSSMLIIPLPSLSINLKTSSRRSRFPDSLAWMYASLRSAKVSPSRLRRVRFFTISLMAFRVSTSFERCVDVGNSIFSRLFLNSSAEMTLSLLVSSFSNSILSFISSSNGIRRAQYSSVRILKLQPALNIDIARMTP